MWPSQDLYHLLRRIVAVFSPENYDTFYYALYYAQRWCIRFIRRVNGVYKTNTRIYVYKALIYLVYYVIQLKSFIINVHQLLIIRDFFIE